jgi:hypothetical protein
MSLLDIAVATTAPENEPSYEAALTRAWSEVIREWPDEQVQWHGAANWLLQAVKSEGPERNSLLGNPSFKDSRCRNAIDGID